MKLLVFDGNSVLNRAYYGVRPLTTTDGLFTNAIYGFLSIFYREMEIEKPDGVCVAFDLPAPTFRHKVYSDYKAKRKPMPDELAMQFPLLKEVLSAMNVCQLSLTGYEADDILGTLAARCTERGDDCIIITGDKDSLQLVSDQVTVKLSVTKGGIGRSEYYDRSKVFETYGFEAARIVDFKALMGDSSDNIPGVAGVGEKTALALMQTFGGIEDLYANLDGGEIKSSIKDKLLAGRENAFLSRELATIVTDVPIEIEDAALSVQPPDAQALTALFHKLEFAAFLKRIGEQGQRSAAYFETRSAQSLSTVAALEAAMTGTLFIAETDDTVAFAVGDQAFVLSRQELGHAYDKLVNRLFCGTEPKAMHDVKAAMTRRGVCANGVVCDAALAAYLINPSAKTDLHSLCITWLGCELSDTFSDRAVALQALTPLLQERLLQDGLDKLMGEIELPLTFVLSEMEQAGFSVDVDALWFYGDTLKERLAAIEEEAYSFVGYFNLNSTKQLGEVLFEKLMLPPMKKNKSGYSTDAETLEKLGDAHPILPLIREYRKLAKLNSTYVEGLLSLQKEGRVHTTFQQMVTQTGRLSSIEPNLQNIPIREQLGRELRRMFVAKPGHMLIDADYSQIELRLLAHMAQDEVMVEAFLSGADIHAITASQVFGVSIDQVSAEQRRAAKAVNFGIVYGISEFSLAIDIGVSRAQAGRYIQNYFKTYPGIKHYLDRMVAQAKERGYAETLMGRRRYLPELTASNFNTRSFGERAAMNMPIQGTAADIIKLAMVRVRNRLLQEGLQAQLILQVHDELIVEAPLSEIALASIVVREEMENAVALSVPLVVDLRVGANWYDAH